jgi:hypothetical protein
MAAWVRDLEVMGGTSGPPPASGIRLPHDCNATYQD